MEDSGAVFSVYVEQVTVSMKRFAVVAESAEHAIDLIRADAGDGAFEHEMIGTAAPTYSAVARSIIES